MNISFSPCTVDEIRPFWPEYIQSLSSPIDSFMEDHILGSEHCLIMADGRSIGYFAVHKQETITQFFLLKPYRRYAQEIFAQIKRVQFVRLAFVPTADEFFLTHAIDTYRTIDMQAYFFQDSEQPVRPRDQELSVRLAVETELEDVKLHSGNFFAGEGEELRDKILQHTIYFAERGSEIVGFGVVERGQVLTGYASIGMYTKPHLRRTGVGRSILLALKEEVRKEGLTPIAGCWYYNHNSKKTLESAGMFTATRLLKVSY